MPLIPSIHQGRVIEFMHRAGQEVPGRPMVPCDGVRLLRAKLILEEALETCEALGYKIQVEPVDTWEEVPPNLTLIADGCADLSVVTIGTLAACGIIDAPILAAVDVSNLAKFGPGGHRREDGKWMKPPGWQPPDLLSLLRDQGFEG